MDKPTVGRIVHYVAYGTPGGEYPAGICRAATVTEVPLELDPEHMRVGLCIMNPTGLFFARDVRYAEPELVHGKRVPVAGTWHWPERA